MNGFQKIFQDGQSPVSRGYTRRLAAGLILGFWLVEPSLQADEPIRAALGAERIGAKLDDRLKTKEGGGNVQPADLRLVKAPPRANPVETGVRAEPARPTTRAEKTRRVAASQ